MHFICFFVQGVIVYACMRGREEIAFCEVDEFLIIDEKTVSFQMKRDYKSCKLDAQYNDIHEPAQAIVGEVCANPENAEGKKKARRKT